MYTHRKIFFPICISMATVLSGLLKEVGKGALKTLAAKGAEKFAGGAIKLAEDTASDAPGFWEGLKEGAGKLWDFDFDGALKQASDYFRKPSPTDRSSRELAYTQKKRPKDAARKHMLKKKLKKKYREEDEDDEEYEDEADADDIADEFELVGDVTGEMPRPRKKKPEVEKKKEGEKTRLIAATDESSGASTAPSFIPATKGPALRVPRVAGGVKPVPDNPYGKLEFTSASLFPQPRTAIEARRPPVDRPAIHDIIKRMEKIYGPMDSTVRQLKKNAKLMGGSQFGGTSGEFVPASRERNSALASMNRNAIDNFRRDPRAIAGNSPNQTEYGGTTGLRVVPEMVDAAAFNRLRLPPPSYRVAVDQLNQRRAGLTRLPPPSYREAMAQKAGREVAAAIPLPKQKAQIKAEHQMAPHVDTSSFVSKTGKPLRGAALTKFEKSQVKITVPKKKLAKK
jgi:hypothetical protein